MWWENNCIKYCHAQSKKPNGVELQKKNREREGRTERKMELKRFYS